MLCQHNLLFHYANVIYVMLMLLYQHTSHYQHNLAYVTLNQHISITLQLLNSGTCLLYHPFIKFSSLLARSLHPPNVKIIPLQS